MVRDIAVRIALIGGTGRIGRAVVDEALAQGHEVRALLRPGRDAADLPAPVTQLSVDVFDAPALASALTGCDALVSAYGVPASQPPGRLAELTTVLVRAAEQADVERLVTVGGAGMLETAPGQRLADAPDFPHALLPKVEAHADAVAVLHALGASLAWTCVAPPAQIGPSPRTGRWRSDAGRLVRDAEGASRIGYADFASALVDELVARRFPRGVMAVGE